mgnify:CR=1 FL=1
MASLLAVDAPHAMRTFGDAIALKATAAVDLSAGRQEALIDTLDAARRQFDAVGSDLASCEAYRAEALD